ncbi:MAG: hypothetical protein KJ063_02400 [Anaerolineae bacterium]|nr:hypothetical protein [Anaerolineae bacterium]
MTTLQLSQTSLDDLKKLQADLRQAAQEVSANSGLKGLMTQAILQVDRFVAGNIEVDTGWTKNSIFPDVSGGGNSVVAQLSTSVHYAPYVRDRRHQEQFFDYANRREVPKVIEWLAETAGIKVEAVLVR